MSTETVLSELTDGVMTITLNRPDAANAVRPDDRNALIALLAAADADEKVRVVVLRANGKHFCAGADVGSLAERRAQGDKRVMDRLRRPGQAPGRCRVRVLASPLADRPD